MSFYLMGALARHNKYTPDLCRAICNGLYEQKRNHDAGFYLVGNISLPETWLQGPSSSSDVVKEAKESGDRLHEEYDIWKVAWDDVTGAWLNLRMVEEARNAEMEYFKRMKVYRKVPLSKCIQLTGKRPIGVRWADVNKQDETNPKYESRLVAQQFKTGQ